MEHLVDGIHIETIQSFVNDIGSELQITNRGVIFITLWPQCGNNDTHMAIFLTLTKIVWTHCTTLKNVRNVC